MKRRRVTRADIGRAMEAGTAARHNIKRVSRFVTSERVNVAKGAASPAADATRRGIRSRGG